MARKPNAVAPVEPFGLSPNGELWFQVVALHARVGGLVEKTLQRRLAIGFSEFLALASLSRNPIGELRMQELADLTSLNQSSVSRLVARLETSGLTERRMCEHDRRGVYTGITDAGRRLLHEASALFEQTLDQMFGQLTADRDLGPLLQRLLTAAGDRPSA